MKEKKKVKKTDIDEMLKALYATASLGAVNCEHCGKKFEVGNFDQQAKAMALILQYEKIKTNSEPGDDGNWFNDDKEKIDETK